MSYYKQLKYLRINLCEFASNSSEIMCMSLKDCLNLTHLELSFYKVIDSFFNNIYIYLPPLKYLNIKTNSQLTDVALH